MDYAWNNSGSVQFDNTMEELFNIFPKSTINGPYFACSYRPRPSDSIGTHVMKGI